MKPDSKISLFRDYFDPDPLGETTIYEFCAYVKNSPEFVKEFEALRDPKLSKEQRDKIKATLPAVTPSGSFTRRKADELKQHSGFVCLDFDSGKNPTVTNWRQFRDDLLRCQNIYFAALSASGKGVFALVPIAYPHLHGVQAKQLIDDIAKAMDIHPDKACKDVCRLRGISHDPDAKFNHDAIMYYKVSREVVKKQYSKPTSNKDPLDVARRMIREAEIGERHDTILKASILLGGYIASGQINESEAVDMLRSEARSKLPSQRHPGAFKTIADGINHGKRNPIQK